MTLTKMNNFYTPFDSSLTDFFNLAHNATSMKRYPLTDIYLDDDEILYVDIACAGFSKEQIDIEVDNNQLRICGTRTASKDTANKKNKKYYLQQFISESDFERTILIHQSYVDGDLEAKFENGILSVKITPVKEKENIKKIQII